MRLRIYAYALCLALVLATTTLSLSAQSEDVQQSIQILENTSGKERIELLFEITRKLATQDAMQGKLYAQEALTLADELQDAELLSKAYVNYGVVQLNLSFYHEAMVNYEEALRIANENNLTYRVAVCYNNMGVVYNTLNQYDISIQYYSKALDYFQQIDSIKGIASCYNNIAVIFANTKNYSKAFEYLERALKVYQHRNDTASISFCYSNMAFYYIETDDFSKSQYYIDLFIALNDTSTSDYILAHYFNYKYLFEKKLGDYSKAKVYALQSMDIYKSLQIKDRLAIMTLNLARIEIYLGHYDDAIDNASDAMEIVQELHLPRSELDVYNIFYLAFEKKNQPAKALKYLKLKQNLESEMYSQDKMNQISNLETFNEIENQKQALQKLEMKSSLQEAESLSTQRSYLLLIIFLLFISSSGYALAAAKSREKQKINEKAQKALRAQMNPHFIFNVLGSIQKVVLKNDSEKSDLYFGKFALMMRNMLDSSMKSNVTLDEELNFLSNYMDLENLRMTIPFDYTINVDKAIDRRFTKIPSMIIQPFVENSIWHGLSESLNQGLIELDFAKAKGGIQCRIRDNGIGLDKAKEQQKQRKNKGYGMQITNERLCLLKSDKSKKNRIEIKDLGNMTPSSSGTEVKFFIPIN